MTLKNHRCDELGVCQGLSAKDCQDCDAWECEVPASPEPPRPTYPFAPGVIQGPDMPIQFLDEDRLPWFSPLELLLIVLLLFVLAGLGGLLAGVLA